MFFQASQQKINNISKEEIEDQKSIQSGTAADHGHHRGNLQKHITSTEPKGQSFPSRQSQDCKEQTRHHNKHK